MKPEVILKLFNLYYYARDHGALAQQNRAFACLLARALASRDGRLKIDIHAKQTSTFDLRDVKDALVAIVDTTTKRSIRAPLCRPLEVGLGTPLLWARAVIASIAIETRDIVELKKGNGSAGPRMRELRVHELQKLDDDIRNAVGGKIPDLYEPSAGERAQSHAA